MTTLNVRIDDELDRRLTRLAHDQHRNKSDLVREMLQRQTTLTLFKSAFLRTRFICRQRFGWI